jgi:hypothetical protein
LKEWKNRYFTAAHNREKRFSFHNMTRSKVNSVIPAMMVPSR